MKDRQYNGPKMDKQRSTKHTHKNKDRVTRTPQKTAVELRKTKHSTVQNGIVKITILHLSNDYMTKERNG